jgi:hypothetical protein
VKFAQADLFHVSHRDTFYSSAPRGSVITDVQLPGPLPTIGAALVLLAAAIVAAVWPAARAARVDVVQALRAE